MGNTSQGYQINMQTLVQVLRIPLYPAENTLQWKLLYQAENPLDNYNDCSRQKTHFTKENAEK